MIYADAPRKYSRRGHSWSHVWSPSPEHLVEYAKKHGLKRKHRYPWIHYDVTAEELKALPDIVVLDRRKLFAIMAPYKQPRLKVRARLDEHTD